MMSDEQTTVHELKQVVAQFVDERNWQQFHTPKNLVMSLAIEAAELMEHFQWLTPEEAQAVAKEPAKLAEVADELADVLCYALALANCLQLDVATAMRAKMIKNAVKYPAAKTAG